MKCRIRGAYFFPSISTAFGTGGFNSAAADL